MKNTALVITILATLIGTASVSFGDTSCAKNLTVKSGLSKLPTLKNYYVSVENNGTVGHLENDPRTVLDRNQHPEYNAIGTVKTSLGRGSAWLGNECLVWTAKHVLGRNKNVIGQKVTFSVGQSQTADKDFAYDVEGEVVASGNPEGLVSENPKVGRIDGRSEDWALVKLKKSIGKQVGFIPAAQYSVTDAGTCKALEVAGYPGEKSVKTLWWQGNCKLYDGKNESDSAGIYVGCPVTPGNSGGPLLCRETDGKLYAIGIMNQQVPNVSKGLAVNFTGDMTESAKAFSKYQNTCN